jgi:hypothetical protein
MEVWDGPVEGRRIEAAERLDGVAMFPGLEPELAEIWAGSVKGVPSLEAEGVGPPTGGLCGTGRDIWQLLEDEAQTWSFFVPYLDIACRAHGNADPLDSQR